MPARGPRAARALHAASTPAPQTLAIFADPVFERAGTQTSGEARGDAALPRLPATRIEAERISALVTAAQRWQAVGFDASRAAVLSPRIAKYRILHFATHGLLETDHPEQSALALSFYDRTGQSQDGYLRLLDIYNLKTRADLVVLSACQTALGQEVRGEGLIGPARAFLFAGVPRVIGSLWKTDDEATAELMFRFYQALLGPAHPTVSGALRTAQLSMQQSERWKAPYFWAGFVLEGDPR